MSAEPQDTRMRSLLAMVMICLWIALYALIVTRFIEFLLPLHTAVEIILYAFFGLVWIWPAKWILNFFAKQPKE